VPTTRLHAPCCATLASLAPDVVVALRVCRVAVDWELDPPSSMMVEDGHTVAAWEAEMCDMGVLLAGFPMPPGPHPVAVAAAMAWGGEGPGFVFACTARTVELCLQLGVFAAPAEDAAAAAMIGLGALSAA
jgi:hypothetical protein